MECHLSGPALDCIACGFLQELSGIQKQHEPDHASAYLSREASISFLLQELYKTCKFWFIMYLDCWIPPGTSPAKIAFLLLYYEEYVSAPTGFKNQSH